MGKRKKAAKPASSKKGKESLPTTFQCLFCNHENSVSVKMDKKSAVGHLLCKVCGQDFDASINYLSHPVDVYGDWIDACDKAAQEAAQNENNGGAGSQSASYREMSGHIGAPARQQQRDAPSEDDDDGDGDGEMDDFVENDEIDAEADYA